MPEAALFDLHLSDANWLSLLSWRKSAPDKLRKAAGKGDMTAFGQHLLGKDARLPSKKRKVLSDAWSSTGIPTGDQQSTGEFVAELIGHGLPNADRVTHVLQGLGLLIGVDESELSADQFAALWRWCLSAAIALMDGPPATEAADTLQRLLLEAELPLVAGYVFRDLKQSRDWMDQGQKAWASWWEDQTDGDGSVHARWLPHVLPLLQSFARSESIAGLEEATLLSGSVRHRFEQAAEKLMSLVTPGRLIDFSSNSNSESLQEFSNALAQLEIKKSHPVRQFLQTAQAQEAGANISRWELPDESHQSDWTEWAALRNSWTEEVDQVLVRYDGDLPWLDVVLSGQPVFSGAWGHKLSLGKKVWQPKTEWSAVCFFSDEESDFIELQQQDSELGLTCNRQIILNKIESLLMFVDVIRLQQPQEMTLQSTLNLTAPAMNLQQDALTRESVLIQGRQRVRVLPVAWPQDRFAPASGGLELQGGRLTFTQSTKASALCVPVVFDAKATRRTKPVDWTRLTIAEDGRYVDATEAFGVRFRIGREQWLYFHNLNKPAIPRTVMGLHTSNETVYARVSRQGQYEPLVQVEL